jgi:hypothetical protein
MAKSLTITIQDDAKAQWIMDGFMYNKPWQADVPNPAFDSELPEDPQTNPSTIPNPVTKFDYIKNWLIKRLRNEAIVGHTAIQNSVDKSEAYDNIVID